MGSLDRVERDRVNRGLEALRSSGSQQLARSGKIIKLNTISGDNLYSYRAGARLRVVLSQTRTGWIVEDIVDHDRLLRILPKGGGGAR